MTKTYEKKYSLPSRYSSSFPDLIVCCSESQVATASSSSKSSSSSTTPPPPLVILAKKPLKSSLSSENLMDRQTSPNSIDGSSGMKRNVSFGTLNIREYERTLGDHPDSTGPPLALSWKYRDVAQSINILDYEECFENDDDNNNNNNNQEQHNSSKESDNVKTRSKAAATELKKCQDSLKTTCGDAAAADRDTSSSAQQQRPRRRSGHELRIPASQRWSLLQDECGISRAELQATMKEIHKIKNSRLASRAMPANARQAQAVLESALRKFKRWSTGVSSQKEQERLWKQAKEWALERVADSGSSVASFDGSDNSSIVLMGDKQRNNSHCSLTSILEPSSGSSAESSDQEHEHKQQQHCGDSNAECSLDDESGVYF